MQCTIIPEDIQQKMCESIFMYRGKPYYLKNHGAGKVDLYELDKTDVIAGTVQYNDPDLDFASIPLGFVNTKNGDVIYLVRLPVRKVKQGINQQNTKMIFLQGAKKGMYNIVSILFSSAFVDMAQNKYPSLEDAISKLRKKAEYQEVAIRRDIALSIDEQGIIKVYYKTRYVGWIEPNKFVVHVKSDDLGWVVSKYLSHVLGWQID